jgi:hypothetical protein
MLVIREEHTLRGTDEEAFDAALRDEWIPGVARGSDARVAFVARLAHGAGEAYRMVTYSFARDAAAWGRLADRIHAGDLKRAAARLDDLRYSVDTKLLTPMPWSRTQTVDLEKIPPSARNQPLTLYMEDTVHPFPGKLDEYIERSGAQYSTEYSKSFPGVPKLLEIDVAMRTTFGGGARAEIVLWQRVLLEDGLLHLLTSELPEEFRKPGRWMVDALALRDSWRSRLLRTVSWSPLAQVP